MPPTLTYPGVYIVEAPSGVHTITGVATSIAAFFGQASMGPLNTPIQCLSYSDYTRNLGAPVPGANVAQSVQEFFSNGGSECYVVRLAHGAAFAQLTLKDLTTTEVLNLVASSPGIWGAGLSVKVDYNTPAPDSTFNLQVTYSSGAAIVQTETFANLSMDPSSPRYAPQFINQSSVLLTANTSGIPPITGSPGYSEARGIPPTAANSWNAAIIAAWPSTIPDLGSFQISVDGGPWSTVTLSLTELKKPIYATDAATFAYFITQINAAIGSPVSNTGVDVGASNATAGFLQITSKGPSPTATQNSVQVRPSTPNDLAQPFMMGVNQGGIEVTRFADHRPAPTGMYFAPAGANGLRDAMDQLAVENISTLTNVTLNGSNAPVAATGGPEFYQGSGGATDLDGVRENLQNIASAINSAFPGSQAGVAGYHLFVQNLNPASAQTIDTLDIPGVTPLGTFVANVAAYSLGITTSGTYYKAVLPAPTDGVPPSLADYTGIEAQRTGFWALDAVDLFNLMVIPGDGITTSSDWDAIRAAAAQYCQSRRAFLILDAPVDWNLNSLSNAQSIVQTFRSPLGNSDINCAVYFPRVQINDNGILRYVGPSGMIAGMYATTDAARGVWKAPAGTQAALNGVLDLEVILTDKQNGILNPLAVNCLRRMPAGYLIWGARTVAGFDNSGDSDWTYVPVRRMALFLEESLYRGTQWVVFEPNDDPLWAQIRMNIGAFMMGLFRQGAFQGATPDQAFFVKCDSETTTQADIDQGIVNIIVGFAPLKPAEFVIITIQQIAGDLT
jgi:hypothetical protein